MLELDLNKESNDIVVTVSENSLYNEPVYVWKLHSNYDNTDTSIILPANTSNHKNRYDLFSLDSIDLIELKVGRYSYKIYEYETVEMDGAPNLVEQGMVKVIDTSIDNAYVEINADESDNDFITYD